MHIIPLIKLKKRKIFILHRRTPNSIYTYILPHMCLKPPERAWNDETKERYDNSNIRFKIYIIRSNLCDHSDSYILVIGIITVPNIAAAGGAGNNTNKKAIFVLLFLIDNQNKWYKNR